MTLAHFRKMIAKISDEEAKDINLILITSNDPFFYAPLAIMETEENYIAFGSDKLDEYLDNYSCM